MRYGWVFSKKHSTNKIFCRNTTEFAIGVKGVSGSFVGVDVILN